MSSSSTARYDAHRFRLAYHQKQFEKHVAKKTVTLETNFELQKDQYPEIQEQIAKRGWKRLTNPRTKISNLLIQEFYANAVRTKKEIASGEAYRYQSYVRGVNIDFSAANIREILRIRDNTPGAETDFNIRQREDQKLDEVIREICVPGNKSEITVARAVLIHSIIKGDDVRTEELIADNIPIIAEGVQGSGKLIFPSTIYRLCKEAEVPLREFRGGELILVDKPITARVMVRTRGRNTNYNQNQQEEEEQPEPMQQDENEAQNEDEQEHEKPNMHYEAPDAGFQKNFGEQQ
ncbi:hypothetical protein PIB30_095551 [Stylosanthes scabra]|uniref:Putative plant transposon protein domain-containing protein n=1 Tax=Stylosanthes scabra TaxID=79078 RepID=A0ABU6VVV1_9FABA|nr:hypothetical protein [Stylosanthes scabra]